MGGPHTGIWLVGARGSVATAATCGAGSPAALRAALAGGSTDLLPPSALDAYAAFSADCRTRCTSGPPSVGCRGPATTVRPARRW